MIKIFLTVKPYFLYNHSLHQQINTVLQQQGAGIGGESNLFFTRFIANGSAIHALFNDIYGHHPQKDQFFSKLVAIITDAWKQRPAAMKDRDQEKLEKGTWYLSNEITGMSLYVDRFCGTLAGLSSKLSYFQQLGVNLLHLMPLFETPSGESDGGYAVSDFRKIDPRFGSLDDLKSLQQQLQQQGMYLMLDIVLNHTSDRHEWALKAKQGDSTYADYFYTFPDRTLPDAYDKSMPEVFPESAPGNFTFIPGMHCWVMTVFHHYQWDLNYTNPLVFLEMLDTILFYANLGVDILRIDAPAFIWKQPGTTCQNLPQVHTLLRLIRQCVQVAAPGMTLLAEAIVAPKEIMKYFGTGLYMARECEFAYNATHMALQWDALATGDTRVMLAAQHELSQKPYGTSWINYTRCHDDIGLGYEDYMIQHAGFTPLAHRQFLKDYYCSGYPGSPSTGCLFSFNPKTNDARISGSLASLCGLEKAIKENNERGIAYAIHRILLMQAHSFFLGGIPMLFYGDERGQTNDYSYLNDPAKSYDNRWMHRPVFNWEEPGFEKEGSIAHILFNSTRRLISIRKTLPVISDHKNLAWLPAHNSHVAGYVRTSDTQRFYGLFNFSDQPAPLAWYAFKEHGKTPASLFDHWEGKHYTVGHDHEQLLLQPYQFLLLEVS